MLVPKLRFKEFEDEWNNFKLNNVVKRILRKNKNNESNLPLTISAQYGLVDQITFFNKNVSSSDLSNYYLIYNGEFAYNKSYSNGYPWGTVKKLKFYDKGVISNLYICFSTNSNMNSDFLEHYFETTKWYYQVSTIAIEGARNHGLLNIAVDDFFNTKHYFPNISEQEKIANFLALLDQKIELQKRKIETLKIYKIGIFNKIYDEKMKTIKEEEIKKYAYLQGGYAFKSELFTKKGVPIIRIANINENLVDTKDIVFYDEKNPIDSKFEINTGDILIAMSGATTGKIGIYKETAKSYLNQRVGKIVLKRKDIMYSYLYFLFELSSYNRQLSSKLVAGAQPNISPSDIETLNFKVPSIEIQKHIAKIAMNINQKIEIEGNKLKELNKMKKGLLQKMFV